MRKYFLLMAAASALFISCNNESSNKQAAGDTTTKKDTGLTETHVTYTFDTVIMDGYVVYGNNVTGPRPSVLVVHEWWGLNDYSKRRARELADLGYIAMAVDMYGNGQTASNPDEAMKFAGPFYADPQLAKTRLEAAIAKLKTYSQADSSKIAAIGYCFGGTTVLNAAKLGTDLNGVVSFHGGLAGPVPTGDVKAEMLICHGAADGFVSDQDSTTFRKQLEDAGVKYEFRSYSGAKHAFTNPEATEAGKKFNLDIAYNEAADKNSWNDMKAFLQRIFR